jgi:purine-nucleoside/S-methyl-5'-thioadenosine phosphorylase / adenosine deaminase
VSAAASPVDVLAGGEIVESFRALGLTAFTTGRHAGSFGTQSDEPVRDVMARWAALRAQLGGTNTRLASATQVHGRAVLTHHVGWRGWLRGDAADGHLSVVRGTAMTVTIADCVPVFIGHPSGVGAILHSGWRGTEARITDVAIDLLAGMGLSPSELSVHCGPAICGRCYEVSAEVASRLTGRSADGPTLVDLRAIISAHARERGVRAITVSPRCTRCDNDRFYSHRAGDPGRQLAVLSLAV